MNTLYIVATPIGNLEDITIRAIKTLLTVPLIACEDTRHTGNLIKILSDRFQGLLGENFRPVSQRKFISVRDWNEAKMAQEIVGLLSVTDIALVSDAGTPLISDPGYKIVRAAKLSGAKVVPIPGPSALTAAISVSGLPTNKFLFLGFLPKKWEIPPETTTIIYESPKRLNSTVEAIYQKHPEAEIVVAKELTKVYESVTSGQEKLDQDAVGEIVILVYLPQKVSTGHSGGDGQV